MAPAYKKVKLDNNKHKDGAMETAKIKISETSAEVTARKKSNSNVDIRNVRRGNYIWGSFKIRDRHDERIIVKNFFRETELKKKINKKIIKFRQIDVKIAICRRTLQN